MLSDKPLIWGSGIAVLAGAAALYYFFYYLPNSAPPAATTPQVHLPPPVASEPPIHHPVPPAAESNAAPKLPVLNDSDTPVHDSLTGMPGGAGIDKFLIPQSLVRHIVATIDNLPRKKVAVELRPVSPIAGAPVIAGTADHMTLADSNFQRYGPFIEVVRTVDPKQLAAVYFHFYPLFQEAYEDLGYPSDYFNDRVIEVIDNLLATPDVKGPIELVQPNVMYLYADPKLEALSAGQKTLIRMGSDNAGIVKAKLRELRAVLATRSH
ncbi:MAG TPA: DUF3014 domain-containing protein [Steroidobacteraceae bacterium]|nr:DUF3014 domain-containing protein [Steroidobacteraceae bacterium]